MIDLEKIAEKAWNAASNHDLDLFEACVVLKDAAIAIKQAQETIAQLEKDAGRLDYIDRGNGSIRVDDDCGLTPEYIYFQKGSARQAIDTAMEEKHG